MKKTKIIFSFLLVLSVFTVIIFTGINSSVTKPSAENTDLYMNPLPSGGNISDSFLVAAMDDGTDHNFQYINDSLGLNLWHLYCGETTGGGNNWHYPEGWTFCALNDHLFNPVSDYEQDVHNELDSIGSHNMQAFIHRPKIEYLCYGQRSDYRCVDTSNLEDKDLWFYSFQSPSHPGSDTKDGPPYGDGRYVRFCKATGPNHDYAGLVVSRLKTNNEQCNRNVWSGAWRGDTEHDWYIKPRIRIDSNVAHDLINNPLVCKIIVIGQSGKDTIKIVDIHAINFLDNDGYYNGRYLEEYFSHASNTIDLIIGNRDWGDQWWWSSRGNRNPDSDNNKADIQVYWYGNCDMWIDYVRVDNDIANDLFHGIRDNWIQGEAELACNAKDGVPLKFYIELNEFNDIPAIAYVNKKLNEYCNKNVDMIADQLTFYQYHMCWDDRGKIMTAGQIVKEYVNKIGMRQVYPGCFPFLSIEDRATTYSRIPNTLPRTDTSDILAIPIPPKDYDIWLQGDLDTVCDNFEGQGGGFSSGVDCAQQPQLAGMYHWVYKLSNQISRLADIPIIAVVQAHQWMIHCGEVDREPTNEELDLTTNLPVSYGAKGMVFELYDGWKDPNGPNYWYGFTETDGHTPRYTNVYNQPKWAKLKSIIQRLKTWGPYLMSFSNKETNSYVYRLRAERDQLRQNSYINAIFSYIPGTTQIYCQEDIPGFNSPSGMVYECANSTYLQVATFSTGKNNDPDRYFMIVNRRCSPYKDESSENNRGGRRYLIVQFYQNSPAFDGHNTWNIYNLGNPSAQPIPFNKTSANPVVLGYFMPGEGRLYKIMPAD